MPQRGRQNQRDLRCTPVAPGGPTLALVVGVSQLIRLAAAFAICSLAACGGKSFVSDDPDDQGGSGGTGSGGTSHTAGKTGKGGSTGTAGTAQGGIGSVGTGGSIDMGGTGQAGAAGFCSSFDDEGATIFNVAVAIHNETSAPIYLGQDMVNCGTAPLFQVHDASGMQLATGELCRQSCQLVRSGGGIGCPAICAYPSSIALEPGEVYYTQWQTQYSVQQQLPLECAPSGQQQCSQLKAVQPGVYTFSAFAGSGVDCSATMGSECAPCTPEAGGCRFAGSLITGPKHEASTVEMIDAGFGLKDLPAPAHGAAGSSSSGAAPAPPVRYVNIVFTK